VTFPGVTVVAGVISNFIVDNFGGARLSVTGIIAALFGAFIITLGLTDDKRPKDNVLVSVLVGVINTVLLWIGIYGVASI
jgi:hypothetical protein